MLTALVETLGHEFEHLIQGATPAEEGEDVQPNPLGLLIANQSILVRNEAVERQERGLQDDIEEEDDDDNDDDGRDE